MKVYRVQDAANGRGMYCGSSASFLDTKASDRHPMPKDDAGLRRQGVDLHHDMWSGGWDLRTLPGWVGVRFGFASMAQYRSWVYQHDWRMRLGLLGYRLCVFEAPDEWVRHGDTQAIFEPAQAKLIEDYPPDTEYDR